MHITLQWKKFKRLYFQMTLIASLTSLAVGLKYYFAEPLWVSTLNIQISNQDVRNNESVLAKYRKTELLTPTANIQSEQFVNELTHHLARPELRRQYLPKSLGGKGYIQVLDLTSSSVWLNIKSNTIDLGPKIVNIIVKQISHEIERYNGEALAKLEGQSRVLNKLLKVLERREQILLSKMSETTGHLALTESAVEVDLIDLYRFQSKLFTLERENYVLDSVISRIKHPIDVIELPPTLAEPSMKKYLFLLFTLILFLELTFLIWAKAIVITGKQAARRSA